MKKSSNSTSEVRCWREKIEHEFDLKMTSPIEWDILILDDPSDIFPFTHSNWRFPTCIGSNSSFSNDFHFHNLIFATVPKPVRQRCHHVEPSGPPPSSGIRYGGCQARISHCWFEKQNSCGFGCSEESGLGFGCSPEEDYADWWPHRHFHRRVDCWCSNFEVIWFRIIQ